MTPLFNQRPGVPANSSTGILGRAGGFISRFLGDSRGVWSRVALLFAVLCVIKVLMLVGMRKQIFEAHWRVGGQPWTWMNETAFYLFAFLVGANLWMFGMKCQGGGRRVIHLANGFVLLLGGLFILLTFHSGDQNYLYLVMNGILDWGNLGSYLKLQFFFQWPFVAGWIFVYALLYYALTRTKRDNLIPWMTAVFATTYIALCLGDLKNYLQELGVANCLGIACLLAGRTKKALEFGWFCLALLGVFAVYVALRPFAHQLISLTPQFVLTFGCSLALFVVLTVLAWRAGFYAGWSWLLPFAFFGFFLLANHNYSPAANYNRLLCLGLWLPRYFLGEFALVVFVFIAAILYRRLHPRGALWWVDVMSLILIALAVVDLRLSRIMGTRLDWQLLAFGDSPKMMWRMARPYLPSLAAVLMGLVAVYVIVLWLMGRWSSRRRAGDVAAFPGQGVAFFVSAFLLLGLAGNQLAIRDGALGQTMFALIKTSPLWKKAQNPPMDLKTFTAALDQLGMSGITTANAGPPVRPRRDLNVVLIFGESSYNKYLSLFGGTPDTQPLLSQYRERMEIFPNFFSNFAGSIHARFATFAGLYPVMDFARFTTDRVEVKSIFELLRENGYACSMFYSSFYDYTSFRDFLRGRGLDEMYDADSMPGQRTLEKVTWGLREEETLGAMQIRLKQYAKEGQKFFLTYVPAAPHKPFDSIPERFRKYKMTEYENYEPRYLNEMLYMDWIITSLLDELKTNGLLDKTLVIFTADHGEMLGVDGGAIGHGWAVTPELANVPLIIMDPDHPGYRVNETVGSEVDLLPTMMDILGLAMPQDQLYQGASLYSANLNASRLIYLNSFRQYAIVRGRQIICSDRESEGAGAKVFEIKNEGARTTFPAMETGAGELPGISAFDIFQENFLRNYAYYCRMIRQPK